jgi:hypothetical protein
MTVTEVTPRRGKAADDPGTFRSPIPVSREPERPRMRIIPLLLTLGTVALAGLLGWGMWEVYMGTPWTRDATRLCGHDGAGGRRPPRRTARR